MASVDAPATVGMPSVNRSAVTTDSVGGGVCLRVIVEVAVIPSPVSERLCRVEPRGGERYKRDAGAVVMPRYDTM